MPSLVFTIECHYFDAIAKFALCQAYHMVARHAIDMAKAAF